jgi:predicted MFS family arabinose efflux permease
LVTRTRGKSRAAVYVEAIATETSHPTGISRSLVVLLAVTCGAAVANLYYAQPLLHTLAGDFDVSNATAGLLVTVSQLGYVIGLALLVPVGDLRERRGLITVTLAISAIGLAIAAAAPGFVLLGAALGAVGVTSTVAQVIVPMASSLAADHERGRVVGTVMSGLLVGILLARTFSGLVAAVFGWRTVFVIAAVAMLVLAATLRRALPVVPPTTKLSYGGLLRSVAELIGSERVLRQRMILGALSFGCFSALWTAVAFLLAGAPYNYGNAVIGLFGLVGVVGAATASIAGRLTDRGWGRQTMTASIVTLLASWAALAAGKSSVVTLIVGIALLDLGAQGLHISNQSAIYSLRPDARSRLTTAYMVSCFLGASLFSALAATIFDSDGWIAVCVLGASSAALALAIWTGISIGARARSRRAHRLEPAGDRGG